ncbi:MAG TPA: hypothetical protein DDY71_03570 [Spirochaetia bacterium]|nr:hypothetical protein [Spirochaetia bacterium]HBI36705.1 hypothetical protein [Spirochaetia bacterium]
MIARDRYQLSPPAYFPVFSPPIIIIIHPHLYYHKVKREVWRYVMIYYNRIRISTVNKNGLPPTKFKEMGAKLSDSRYA